MSSNDNKIKWSKVSETLVKSNPYHAQAEKHYVLPNGNPKIAYTGHHKPFVIGMALTPSSDLILVKEYRPGPDKLMLDLPCGSMNRGEDPTKAMLRELQEETGYAGEPEFVNSTLVGPYSNQIRHTFLIRNCVKVSEQNLDHDEFIEVVQMPLEEFVNDYVLTGETTNAGTVMYCLNALGILSLKTL